MKKKIGREKRKKKGREKEGKKKKEKREVFVLKIKKQNQKESSVIGRRKQ